MVAAALATASPAFPDPPRAALAGAARIVPRMAADLLGLYRNNPDIFARDLIALGWTKSQIAAFSLQALQRALTEADKVFAR